MKSSHFLSLTALVVTLGACLPAHLQKYRKEPVDKQAGGDGESPLAPVDTGVPLPQASESAKPKSSRSSEPQGGRATIYAVDKQTYRFQVRENDVWDSALHVLLRNYNLTIVDRQTGIITTEWDSYFLSNAVYRNKVSLRLRSVGRGAIDVTIHNNVERLRDAAQTTGAVGAVWLPAEDTANEVARIVQNMALVLNQPPPVLPPNVVAKGAVPAGQPATR